MITHARRIEEALAGRGGARAPQKAGLTYATVRGGCVRQADMDAICGRHGCRVMVAGLEGMGAKEGRMSGGSLLALQDRGELIQQGTHQQTHPRQRQTWSPSPASMSPALRPAADVSSGSYTSASDESLEEANAQLPATGSSAVQQLAAASSGDFLTEAHTHGYSQQDLGLLPLVVRRSASCVRAGGHLQCSDCT